MNAPRLQQQRILVPVTLTPESCRALPEAVRLVKRYGGEIVLLHVVKLHIVGEEYGVPRSALCNGLCRDAEKALERLADEFIDPEVAIKVKVLAGEERPLIVNVATQIQADLIVMTARPLRGFRKWFGSSTADYVLKHAHCPVWLLCPSGENGGVIILVDGNDREIKEPEPYANSHALRTLLRV